MSVAEKSQIEPVIVAVAAAGLEHVGQQVGGVAREDDEIVGLDLSGHARHVRIAVVVVVHARNIEIGLPTLDRGNVVHQRDNAPALDGADQHGEIALRLGAVVIAQHRVYADSGGNGGQIFKKGNGSVAVLGVVAAQNDQIGAETVDGLDQLVDPALGKPASLMNIRGVDDFQVFQIGGQVGYLYGVFVHRQHSRFDKGINAQRQKRQRHQRQTDGKMPPLGFAITVMIFRQGRNLLPSKTGKPRRSWPGIDRGTRSLYTFWKACTRGKAYENRHWKNFPTYRADDLSEPDSGGDAGLRRPGKRP